MSEGQPKTQVELLLIQEFDNQGEALFDKLSAALQLFYKEGKEDGVNAIFDNPDYEDIATRLTKERPELNGNSIIQSLRGELGLAKAIPPYNKNSN